MLITDAVNPIKVCDLFINRTKTSNSLWGITWCDDIDNPIFTENNGRCYLIVVNKKIFKIGYSDCKGGIKSTINTYKNSGNSGRPSDRTHGIHRLIAEQLCLNNEVEIYFFANPMTTHDMTLIDGSVISVKESLSGKPLEIKNLEIFKKINGEYPVWNYKEANKPYPEYIQESRINLLNKKPLTLADIEKRLAES